MGLGLFSTKAIVENYGGEISLNSKVGHSLEFSVIISI